MIETKINWISVKEKLPEDSSQVIMAVKWSGNISFAEAGYYEEDKDEWYNVDGELRQVTYWTQLPKCPNNSKYEN